MPSATLIEKCCLVASPVAGNPTHYLVEQTFAQSGLDWRFMSFEVDPERLGDAMRGLRALGFHGVKVGEPFHESVITHLDDLTETARRCGSVNSITAIGDRFIGDCTEGPAFVELVRQHIDPVGRRATVIGTGRLARSIALALGEVGMAAVTVVGRNATTGRKLVELVRQHTSAESSFLPLDDDPIGAEPDTAVVVNATSIGSTTPEARLPIKLNSLDPKAIVSDVSYNVPRTWLMQQAAEHGCRVIDGLSIYVQQTALALRAWTGTAADTAAMRDAAEEFLGI